MTPASTPRFMPLVWEVSGLPGKKVFVLVARLGRLSVHATVVLFG